MPVVDLALLVGAPATPPTRWVVVRTGGKRTVIAVESVEGVRTLASEALRALPSLATGAAQAAIAQLGILDAAVFAVLDAARVIELAEVR
jgi:chemotaxis signal transduction protein